jgi:hypothetical protein
MIQRASKPRLRNAGAITLPHNLSVPRALAPGDRHNSAREIGDKKQGRYSIFSGLTHLTFRRGGWSVVNGLWSMVCDLQTMRLTTDHKLLTTDPYIANRVSPDSDLPILIFNLPSITTPAGGSPTGEWKVRCQGMLVFAPPGSSPGSRRSRRTSVGLTHTVLGAVGSSPLPGGLRQCPQRTCAQSS